MYKAFFNLTRNPFELTPDPAFLFSTKRHNEALAALYYGVRQHKGFVVVTGEVGTGKTLLLRCLLRLLREHRHCLRLSLQQPAVSHGVPAVHSRRLRASYFRQEQERTVA